MKLLFIFFCNSSSIHFCNQNSKRTKRTKRAMQTPIGHVKSLINPTLLESDPATYYERLLELKSDPELSAALRYVINDTTSERTFNSPPVMQLSYMVGTLLRPDPEIEGRTFYGQHTTISDDMGCLILDAMIQSGADIYIEDFYEDNLQASLEQTHTLTSRKDNTKFKEKVDELFKATRRYPAE